jgi:hypothetical protein
MNLCIEGARFRRPREDGGISDDDRDGNREHSRIDGGASGDLRADSHRITHRKRQARA